VEGLTVKRILGLLGWLGVALVVAAVAIRFIRPEWQPWYQGLALAGLVVTALYGLSQWRDIGRSFQGRNVRYGSLAAGTVVLFLAILVGINWISNRENKRWDLTAGGQFSLSDQTRKVLAGLKAPVTVLAFYTQDTGDTALRDALSNYTYASKQISVQYIDANSEPLKARQYSVQTVPTIVFESGGHTQRATASDEESLTNALKKLVEGTAKKVYFIEGHGEHDPTDSSGRQGYGAIADALKGDNFETAKLTLAQVGTIPDDATVVVIAGPKTDYLPGEITAIDDYLKKGGKLLMMLDPPDKADAPALTNLVALAKAWDIDVGNNIVIDTSGLGQLIGANEAVPIAMPAQGGHPITANFQLMTAFPLARSAAPIAGGVDGRTAQKLLETSPRSWAESDITGLFANGQPSLDPAKGDTAGPVTIASAVSATAPDAPAAASPDAPKPETRVVVVGDSDFISNAAINIQGNRDLGLNMTNWLAQQENLIAIHPHAPEDRRVTLTQDQSERIFWLTIFIVPGLLFANAVRVWWRRR
jgi:gliding motility-associatede transport system auxiliary component